MMRALHRIVLLILASGHAQAAVLERPDIELLASGQVTALAFQADGRMIVGGSFTRVGEHAVRHLVRFNGDGSLDLSWLPQPDAVVRVLALAPDASLLVGGDFDMIAGIARPRLARIDTGAIAQPVAGFVPTIPEGASDPTAMLMGGSGALYVAWFATGFPIQRLDPATGEATLGFSAQANSLVRALAETIDGNSVLVGGNFTSVNGETRYGIARLDASSGALDPLWQPGTPPSPQPSRIRSLLIDGPDHVIAGGEFASLGGLARTGLARLSLAGTGSADPAWAPMLSDSLYVPAVARLDRFGDGDLLVTGSFQNVDAEVTPAGVARLAPGGAPRAGWGASASGNRGLMDGYVTPDGDVWIWRFGSGAQRATVRQHAGANGADLLGLNVDGFGIEATAFRLRRNPLDGRILVAGWIDRIDGDAELAALALAPDLERDVSWSSDLGSAIGSLSFSVVGVQGGGGLHASTSGVFLGGFMFDLQGERTHGVRRLAAADGSLTPWLPQIPGNTFANAGPMDDDGVHLYMGGSFNFNVGGVGNFGNLARFLLSDGSLDSTWRPQMSGAMAALALDNDALLVAVTGTIRDSNDDLVQRVARLPLSGDGRADPLWRPFTDTSVRIDHLAIDALAGWIYMAGVEGSMPYLARHGLADGVRDPSWNPLAGRGGFITSIALAADGALWVSGQLQIGCLGNEIQVARVQPGGQLDPRVGASSDGSVLAVAVADSGAVVVAGMFSAFAGQPRVALAGLSASSTILSNGFEDTSCVR